MHSLLLLFLIVSFVLGNDEGHFAELLNTPLPSFEEKPKDIHLDINNIARRSLDELEYQSNPAVNWTWSSFFVLFLVLSLFTGWSPLSS